MTKLAVTYGSRQIEFRLERKPVRSLAITVQADGKVRVVAPTHATDDQVQRRVAKRGRWIVRQWERQASYLPTPPSREHRNGASLRYLGRQYRIRVVSEQSSHRQNVVLHHAILEVRVSKPKDLQAASRHIDNWLKTRAAIVLAERFQRCLEHAAKYRLKAPQMRLRTMPKRWGSCVRKELILLNPELIRAPVHCIDYVILHELCHLKHPDHGPKFRSLLQQLCPDWKRLKERLERAG